MQVEMIDGVIEITPETDFEKRVLYDFSDNDFTHEVKVGSERISILKKPIASEEEGK